MNKLKLIPFVILSVVGVYAANASLSGTLSGTIYVNAPQGDLKYEVYQVVGFEETLVDTKYGNSSSVSLNYGTLTFDCRGCTNADQISEQEIRIKITNRNTDGIDYGAYFWDMEGTKAQDGSYSVPSQARIIRSGDDIVSDIKFPFNAYETSSYISGFDTWSYTLDYEFYKHLPAPTLSSGTWTYYPQTLSVFVKIENMLDNSNTVNVSVPLYVNVEEYVSTTLTKDTSHGSYVTNTDLFIKIPTTETSVPVFYNSNTYKNTNAVGVVIPYKSSITNIGNYSFYTLPQLTAVSISDSITSIGQYAFYNSGLCGHLFLPKNLVSVGIQSFLNTNFRGLLTLPKTLASLYYNSFGRAFSSVSVEPGGNTGYYSENNAVIYVNPYNTSQKNLVIGCKNTIIGNDIYSISQGAFLNCTGLVGSITIPNSVYSINGSAFSGTNITSVTFGAGLVQISGDAFSNCTNLTGAIVIPNTVQTLGVSAFYNTRITSITLSNSLTSIGNKCFSGCTYLTGQLTIPNSVTTIGFEAFYNTSITSLSLGTSLTSIGSSCFRNCSALASSITIPNSVTTMDSNAFYGTGITGLSIGTGLTGISDYCFYNCSSLSGTLTLPNNITSLGQCCFYGTGITGLSFGSGLTTIGTASFKLCESLNIQLTIPNTVTSLGANAFQGSAITHITLPTNASVTTVPNYLCSGCRYLAYVKLPSNITTIGTESFRYCYSISIIINLTSLTFTNGNTGNGYIAAYYPITVSNNANFSPRTFSFASGYIEICLEKAGTYYICGPVYGTTLYSDYDDAFYQNEIKPYAFYGCTDITTLGFECCKIGDYAFYGCTGITSLYFGTYDSGEEIGRYAFSGCTHLSSINFEIDYDFWILPYAFQSCSSLSTIEFSGNVSARAYTAKNGSEVSNSYVSDFDGFANRATYIRSTYVSRAIKIIT